MSMKFVNIICPNCKNPNYMVLLGDFSKAYKYKCVNCHRFFNDIGFEKEPLQPVWKSECMNSKVDMVEVVRCKDCAHYRKDTCSAGAGMAFPPPGDWFCADGEKR